MTAIEVQEVCKAFGAHRAVDGVSFSVQQGELFGLIGPDGAGKTTLMRMMCTLLVPDSGRIRILGHDVQQEVATIRAMLGYMPQRFSLYPDLTVEQNLHFFAEIFQVPEAERRRRLDQLYGFSRLGPFRDRAAGALSGGMKQKLALSCALIHTPPVLILDEPTFGVDPVSRQEFWEILRTIQAEGTTILVSTAYMEEADLCDRVALMAQGRILALDAPARLKAAFRFPLYRLDGHALHDVVAYLRQQPQVRMTQRFGDAIHVSFHADPSPQDWQRWQAETGGAITRWQPIQPSIEDIFLDLTGVPHAEP